MGDRDRYVTTFRISEYWKGTPPQEVKVYSAKIGSCFEYEFRPGREYLVYAEQVASKDVRPDPDFFWYGWTDLIPKGRKMLVPDGACGPGGEVSQVRANVRALGRGIRLRTR